MQVVNNTNSMNDSKSNDWSLVLWICLPLIIVVIFTCCVVLYEKLVLKDEVIFDHEILQEDDEEYQNMGSPNVVM